MDDVYLINLAKTELREAYNTGDVERLVSVFADSMIDFSQETPTRYGADAKDSLAKRAGELLDVHNVRLNILVVNIVVLGDLAYDRGIHEFTFTPKGGGAPVRRRERYLEIWQKDKAGQWKITVFMSNSDVAERLGGQASTWFLGETAERAAG